MMECINCKNDDSFNRVVVHQVSGEKVGCYCESCESEAFGELLDDPAWHQDHGCAFCDGAGTYKLPTLECVIENDDGSIRFLEYASVGETVTICEDHLQELLPPEDTAAEQSSEKRRSEFPLEA